MTNRRFIGIAVAVLVAATTVFIVAVLVSKAAAPSGSQPAVEVEDCDAEDFRNKEAECGFVPGSKKTTKPAPIPVRTTKPAPRKTS